jgi:hypothetical protein
MDIAVSMLLDGEIINFKKLSQVPNVGDEVEVGKTKEPKIYRVLKRRWRDSMDDWTRVDLHIEEVSDLPSAEALGLTKREAEKKFKPPIKKGKKS